MSGGACQWGRVGCRLERRRRVWRSGRPCSVAFSRYYAANAVLRSLRCASLILAIMLCALLPHRGWTGIERTVGKSDVVQFLAKLQAVPLARADCISIRCLPVDPNAFLPAYNPSKLLRGICACDWLHALLREQTQVIQPGVFKALVIEWIMGRRGEIWHADGGDVRLLVVLPPSLPIAVSTTIFVVPSATVRSLKTGCPK